MRSLGKKTEQELCSLRGFQPRRLVRSKLPDSLRAEISPTFAPSHPRPYPPNTPAATMNRPLALLDDFAIESNSPYSKLPPTVLPLWDTSGPGPTPGTNLNCSYNDHVNSTPDFQINFCYIL
ncbi:Hypothetical predicted protein [Marmota monax]|uniref:Uncharacterized protein n=1 Tax=Marmota monax TaxID=9995 RepID=A0A5E4A2G0_MARMO|nr:Hypothetical predicted protein [Marmota monax]